MIRLINSELNLKSVPFAIEEILYKNSLNRDRRIMIIGIERFESISSMIEECNRNKEVDVYLFKNHS